MRKILKKINRNNNSSIKNKPDSLNNKDNIYFFAIISNAKKYYNILNLKLKPSLTLNNSSMTEQCSDPPPNDPLTNNQSHPRTNSNSEVQNVINVQNDNKVNRFINVDLTKKEYKKIQMQRTKTKIKTVT